MQYDSQPGVGGVFITNITPTNTGTVSNKVYEDDIVLLTCDSDADDITVYVTAMSGSTHLVPRVTVNGESVNNFVINAQMRYDGSVNLTGIGSGTVTIVAIHEDGGYREAALTKVAGPTISSLEFTGGYPGSQTELKLNDNFDVTVLADVDANRIEVDNTEACQALAQDLVGSGPYTVAISIANRGSGTYSNQRAKVRLRGTNGIWGEWVYTDVFGSGDGSAYVQLNNDAPSISSIAQGNISYPASQSALKNSEQATVNHTVTFPTGVGTVVYSSPNNDLIISNNTTYESAKVVTRQNGSYNITTNNFRITATKTSNASVATRDAVVYIANTACTLAVAESATRLRSGGNAGTSAQNHTITITASQRLYSAPTLAAPVGTWQGTGFSGTTTTWTRSLQIHDDNTKGTHAWGAISGFNLAGIETTAITGDSNYTVGGFVVRTILVAAWPNREFNLGTYVANTAKLRATCLAKYSAGTWNEIYENLLVNHNDSDPDLNNYFAITDPSETLNAAGNLFRINDLPAAVSNTSGLLSFEVEEVV